MPMKYKLTICDDDPQQLSHLAAMVSTWSDTTGHLCDIRTFPSAEAFWNCQVLLFQNFRGCRLHLEYNTPKRTVSVSCSATVLML